MVIFHSFLYVYQRVANNKILFFALFFLKSWRTPLGFSRWILRTTSTMLGKVGPRCTAWIWAAWKKNWEPTGGSHSSHEIWKFMMIDGDWTNKKMDITWYEQWIIMCIYLYGYIYIHEKHFGNQTVCYGPSPVIDDFTIKSREIPWLCQLTSRNQQGSSFWIACFPGCHPQYPKI